MRGRIIDYLLNLKGVEKAEVLNRNLYERIKSKEEEQIDRAFSQHNHGVFCSLDREIALVLLKNPFFKDKTSNFVIVRETDSYNADYYIEGKGYSIIGKQEDPKKSLETGINFRIDEKPYRRKGRRKIPANEAFIASPPMEVNFINGKLFFMKDEVVGQPGSTSDILIRDHYKWSHDKRFATLILGYNKKKH